MRTTAIEARLEEVERRLESLSHVERGHDDQRVSALTEFEPHSLGESCSWRFESASSSRSAAQRPCSHACLRSLTEGCNAINGMG